MQEMLKALDFGDELFCEPLRLVPPEPWVGHLPFAYWLIKVSKPAMLVELGTHTGNSYFAFCQALASLNTPGCAYAVDTWHGDEHAGYYGDDVFADVTAFNREHFSTFSTLMRMTFDEARGYFPNGSIDLLHIDGMHTYDTVKHDFETWRSALSDRAVVLLHDVNVRERNFGVWRLWQELSEQHPAFEFVHSHGLGVLGIGPDQPAPLRQLFELAREPEAVAAIRLRFATRGEVFQRRALAFSRQQEQAELGQQRALELSQQLARQQEEIERSRAADSEALRLRDEALQLRDEALRSRDEALRSRDEALQLRDEALRSRDEALRSRDEALRSSDEALRARDEALRWRDNVIASKDALLLAKDEMLELRDAWIHGRDQAIRERDEIIKQRDQSLQKETQLFEGRNAELQHQYDDLKDQFASYRDTYQLLEHRLWQTYQEQLDHTARAYRESLRNLESAYVNSSSWRVTAPLRRMIRLLRGQGPAAPLLAPPEPAGPAAERPPAPSERAPELAERPNAAPGGVAGTPEALTRLDTKTALRRMLTAGFDALLAGPGRVQLPSSADPDVTIILILYNQAELTLWCLASIAETLHASPIGIQTIIVDNASSDATGQLLERIDGAQIVRSRVNLHFLRGVNAAAQLATGRHILLLNNDVRLLPGAVEAAVRTLDGDASIGAVGGRIILPDGSLQEAGSIVWNDGACSGYGRGRDPDSPEFMFQRDVDYCSGAFLMTPRPLFERLGGFDERFAPAYYEETDYCVRLWEAGLRVVYNPEIAVVHYEFGSSSSREQAIELQRRNRRAFCEAHAVWLTGRYPNSPANMLAARRTNFAAKRVLIFEDRVPKVGLGSGYPRANTIIRELVAAGAEVTLFPAFRHKETWPEIRAELGASVEVILDGEARTLRPFLASRRGHYDCILVCRPHNMRSFQEAVAADHSLIGDAKVLYDAEAIFARRTTLARKAAGQATDPAQEEKMIAEEIALTRLADAVISVSPTEQQLFETFGCTNVHLLAHALTEAPICTPFEERPDIVFLGAIHADHSPNADSVRWFVDEILPKLRSRLGNCVRLKVIGLNNSTYLTTLDGSSIDLVGQVADLNAALSSARIMVVPTRFAAGVPHKVHQAAILGIPMVTTTLIGDQIGWTAGQDLLVAANASEFAECCARLYQDKASWETIRENALNRARAECSPAIFRQRLREILDAVPLTHRTPEAPAVELRLPAQPVSLPHVGRPAEADYSIAVPFSYYPEPSSQPGRVAVVAHLFYPDVAAELRHYLENIPVPADLFISTDTNEKRSAVAAEFHNWDKGDVDLRVFPNRGRDIAAKLIGFRDVYDRYKYVLHLHSKKSQHATFLAPWRSFLYENLAGSPFVVASVFEAFAQLPDLGIVFPQHFEPVRRWLDWTGNFDIAQSLASRMGIALHPDRALDFPSGSMFWARSEALRPLLDLGLSFDDFPAEDGQVDHTPAHAIERLYLYACERAGFGWLKIARPELYFETKTIIPIDSPAALSEFVAAHGVMLTGPNPPKPREEPAPMMTLVPPGLQRVLESRGF